MLWKSVKTDNWPAVKKGQGRTSRSFLQCTAIKQEQFVLWRSYFLYWHIWIFFYSLIVFRFLCHGISQTLFHRLSFTNEYMSSRWSDLRWQRVQHVLPVRITKIQWHEQVGSLTSHFIAGGAGLSGTRRFRVEECVEHRWGRWRAVERPASWHFTKTRTRLLPHIHAKPTKSVTVVQLSPSIYTETNRTRQIQAIREAVWKTKDIWQAIGWAINLNLRRCRSLFFFPRRDTLIQWMLLQHLR